MQTILAVGILGVAVFAGACGGGSSTTTPSSQPAAIITIANNGVSPKNVTVPRGSQVQFVNNDSQPHQMHSNPHPEHTDCPELNSVGFLATGQSRQTGNLNTPGACGFHDHDAPGNTGLQGTIVIQ